MSIQVKCPSCGTTLKVKDALAGKRVKCPRCANPFRVPEAAAPEGVTPLGSHAAALYAQFVAAGGGANDFSGIFEWIRDRDAPVE